MQENAKEQEAKLSKQSDVSSSSLCLSTVVL